MNRIVRLTALLVVIIFFIFAFPVATYAVDNDISSYYRNSIFYDRLSKVNITGKYRDDVIAVARSQIGYHEGDNENDYGGENLSGDNDYTEYGRYLESIGRVWCSEFASWCIRTAGVPTDIVNNSLSAKAKTFCRNSTAKYYSWQDTCYCGGSYLPQKGDLILWVWSSFTGVVDFDQSLSHTAIIDEVIENSDGSVTFLMIHGNSNDAVTESYYSVDKLTGHTVTRIDDNIVESGSLTVSEESDSFIANDKGYIGYFVAPDYEKTLTTTGTITFNANGGESELSFKKIAANGIYGALPQAQKQGFDFLGWFTEKEGGQEVSIYTPCLYPYDVTLYAHWKKETGIYLGDVDSDEAVTILDATAIQRHLASLPTKAYNEKAADVDGDGSVTILDATAIQRHLASLPTQAEGIGEPI